MGKFDLLVGPSSCLFSPRACRLVVDSGGVDVQWTARSCHSSVYIVTINRVRGEASTSPDHFFDFFAPTKGIDETIHQDPLTFQQRLYNI